MAQPLFKALFKQTERVIMQGKQNDKSRAFYSAISAGKTIKRLKSGWAVDASDEGYP